MMMIVFIGNAPVETAIGWANTGLGGGIRLLSCNTYVMLDNNTYRNRECSDQHRNKW